MIRSKGEAGTGDVSNATTHMRKIGGEIRRLTSLSEDELFFAAKELQAPDELVVEVAGGQVAGHVVHCGWYCRPGGCGDHYAARRPGCVGDLQVW